MIVKKALSTTKAPAAAHSFSQGVHAGDIVQVSGQGPQDPETGQYLHAGDVGRQTTQTLENVRHVVEASGGTFDDVVSLRVFLTDQSNFAGMNEAYEAFVKEHVPSGALPARTTVFVGLPWPEMLVEIDGMAVLER
ncbi:RidA family protein [Occultella gossypii]|uniref:RidA family protein n=1 Tax=Occultella gossypii TaxID=2800820 RepID=A0ABS7S561_9MICO|nr:RidA family protein [Occultella gossypii]MBZ2195484.1 RidA family protein [Occultella gossypii]